MIWDEQWEEAMIKIYCAIEIFSITKTEIALVMSCFVDISVWTDIWVDWIPQLHFE